MNPLAPTSAVTRAAPRARSWARRWAAALAAALVGTASVPAAARPPRGGASASRQRPQGRQAELLREARAALLRAVPFDAERVRVANLRMPTTRLPAGPFTVSAELRPGERFRGPTTFAVVVEPAEGEPVRLWATVELRVRVSVLVTSRDLPVGHVVGDGDLTYTERELGDGLQAVVASVEEAVGRVVQRPVRAFSPLRKSELRRPVVVERGAFVSVRVNLGGLVASARGKALDAGAVGDRVRVENLSSGKTVQGRVLSGSEVDVEL